MEEDMLVSLWYENSPALPLLCREFGVNLYLFTGANRSFLSSKQTSYYQGVDLFCGEEFGRIWGK